MKTISVWDPFVRIFHWSLAIAIIIQLVSAEDFNQVHVRIGYFIILLLFSRFIWGFVGSKHARFADFIYPPADILAYLKSLIQGRPRRYLGHNPAGAAMVYTLLAFLVVTTLTGVLAYATKDKGPVALGPPALVTSASADSGHVEGGHGAHFWKEAHESIVGIMLFLAGLHVCGVIVSSYVHKENLIRAMITGKKQIE
jgi:cytochrome b